MWNPYASKYSCEHVKSIYLIKNKNESKYFFKLRNIVIATSAEVGVIVVAVVTCAAVSAAMITVIVWQQ